MSAIRALMAVASSGVHIPPRGNLGGNRYSPLRTLAIMPDRDMRLRSSRSCFADRRSPEASSPTRIVRRFRIWARARAAVSSWPSFLSMPVFYFSIIACEAIIAK